MNPDDWPIGRSEVVQLVPQHKAPWYRICGWRLTKALADVHHGSHAVLAVRDKILGGDQNE